MVFWTFILIFFFCELGEMVTDQFHQFSDELGQCSWYLFPIELQRMLVTFMVNAQQPVIIHGFGNTLCTREAFKLVIDSNRTFSKDIIFGFSFKDGERGIFLLYNVTPGRWMSIFLRLIILCVHSTS